MVQGMGGKESDNYVLFLSLAGAAFLTLRRHENVRVLLAHVRLMVGMKEVAVNANPDQVLGMMRERLCLQLSDSEAVSYLEELIENSISSKLWMAVDAIHSLGKRF
jgi:phosphatidylinositol 3-kinase